jgi:methylglutaconyl-CoA hydratase
MTYETIVVERAGPIASVTFNRPDVHNALNARMIAEITETFRTISADDGARVVSLQGEGPTFSGGADINYMRAGLELGEAENYADALRLSDMFASIDECALPVIARVQGAALGGGSGLIAACDIVVAADDAVFGFTEARLGIVPAVISPFVLRKIGQSHARALFTTGERFDAARALHIGLVHVVVPYHDLHAAVQKKIEDVLACGPHATRVAKTIARTVSSLGPEEAREWTARTIAARRASDEGQEGLRAFLEKRKPTWK